MTVIWTDTAIEDLQNIFDYYLANANHRTALKVTDSIVDVSLTIEITPRIGRRDELLENKKEELRFLIEGNYKILYLIEDNFIVVLTVFDCRQNPKKLEIKKQ